MKNFAILILYLVFFSSCEEGSLNSNFEILESSLTGISFSNDLINTKELNILSYLYFYNGGGVATGDINNDGLPDIYFCGNQVDDKLYLNEGDFKFKDISHLLPSDDIIGWSTGVTMIDINHDGYLDIYVSRLGNFKSLSDSNKLFINNKGESFTEQAENYNLNFSGLCTQSAFFDFDRDGDLDCYLLNHSIKDPSQFKPSDIRMDYDSISGDRLLENQNGKFVDITKSANIYGSNIGFGLGIDISDINNDGWLDIYVGNDFHEQDYLYINQGDKTFKESIELSTGHTSNFSMGCNLSDLNNDLKIDVVTMDMKPPSYEDYKKSGGWESMQIYNYKRSFGYHHQSPKNAFQINLGNTNGIPQFSEQSAFLNTSSTDWSWSPLVQDFDNDGDKDIFITNGIQYRPNDLDFIKFHFSNSNDSNLDKLELMPSGLASNLYYENNLNKGSFDEESIGNKNATTGAAVADFDLDGNIDIVLNKVNTPSTILKNANQNANEYISVRLIDSNENYFALGAKLNLYQDGLFQTYTVKSSSGFQSCNEPVVHFGLNNISIDSLEIIWADGYRQVEYEIDDSRNGRVFIEKQSNLNKFESEKNESKIKAISNFKSNLKPSKNQIAEKWLLYDPNCTYDLLLPIDDSQCFVVNDNGQTLSVLDFQSKEVRTLDLSVSNDDLIFLDAGATNNNQYYILSQSILGDLKNNEENYLLQLHILSEDLTLISSNKISIDADFSRSKFLVEDFDNDNDLDIVIGGGYIQHQYGKASSTLLLINEGNSFDEKVLLEDDLVYDMQFADVDVDGELELIIAGHWFPITVFDNLYSEIKIQEIPNSSGLWFSLAIADFDSDNVPDILAGNFGLNHDLRPSAENPLRLYFNDFDKNGQFESLITYMSREREVPYYGHETFIEQLPIVKRDYIKASDFASASITDIIEQEKLKESNQKMVDELRSCLFKFSEGSWSKSLLPNELNKFPITNIVYNDSVLLVLGNLSLVDPNLGRQDAGQILGLQFNDSHVEIVNSALPIERGVVLDGILNDATLYYMLENDSLRYFNF